jgi:hypothetical protein
VADEHGTSNFDKSIAEVPAQLTHLFGLLLGTLNQKLFAQAITSVASNPYFADFAEGFWEIENYLQGLIQKGIQHAALLGLWLSSVLPCSSSRSMKRPSEILHRKEGQSAS